MGRKITQKQDFETYHKHFHDFKIGPKFSKTHVFWKTTLYHPLELLRGILLFYWLSHNHCKLAGGKYRIYLINCRGRLLHFWTLRVGWPIQGGRLFEAGRLLSFHHFQQA